MHQFPVLLASSGVAAAFVAAAAWAGDRRRMRRRNLDAVGFMPWTGVFLLAFFAAVVLLGLAGRAWIAG